MSSGPGRAAAVAAAFDVDHELLIDLNDAIDKLATEDDRCAQIVKLRFFAGLTLAEAAELLGLSLRTAEREWAYTRAWLFEELSRDDNLSAR